MSVSNLAVFNESNRYDLFHVKLMIMEGNLGGKIVSFQRSDGKRSLLGTAVICMMTCYSMVILLFDFLKSNVHVSFLDEIFSPLKSLYPYFM